MGSNSLRLGPLPQATQAPGNLVTFAVVAVERFDHIARQPGSDGPVVRRQNLCLA
ncbi:hypothetical protein D3C77_417940 [compost metagenome]